METLRIVYFPLEQKYSIWDHAYNLVAEWFETRGLAEEWIKNNVMKKEGKFIMYEQLANGIKIYLESHCERPVWNRDIACAKRFDNRKQVEACIKFWKLNTVIVEPI